MEKVTLTSKDIGVLKMSRELTDKEKTIATSKEELIAAKEALNKVRNGGTADEVAAAKAKVNDIKATIAKLRTE